MNRVFVSGVGQYDNIGDTVLRRGLIDAVRPGVDLHVLVADLTADYQSGLQLAETDTVYTSVSAWHRAMMTSALRRRTWVLHSAGEAIADLHSAPERALLFTEALLLRPRGGGAMQTGVGIRKPVGKYKLPLLASLRPAKLVTWRDQWSQSVAGFGSVTPDWGYAEGAAIETFRDTPDRPLLSITLRGDRAHPSDSWIANVKSLAEREGLRLTVVTQVQSDTARSETLAEELGADLLTWETDNHFGQETLVREAYARSRAVISDRVHALIIGLTEGAVPLAYAADVPEKAARTLETAGITGVAFSERNASTPTSVDDLVGVLHRDTEMREHLRSARERLGDLTSTLRRILQAKGSDR
ncbi:hypothetical protein B7R54_03150 [Subtercola boreus]|uniref:Polysaccharide pyruvyl transferase domain-containing protein n=1 Tax=Subtercola boreus TaxID=120213 RepID=A0A3E0VEJ4_9MICO|nr:polysaccharide pyruvyl transferase family protein [Subtercola boreus]RFA08332.1 hypothetical protein B7R54_03150 [Subtercola boreus]TQL54764.1 hypothetical protein FB464_2308 [Subtercola boreus]